MKSKDEYEINLIRAKVNAEDGLTHKEMMLFISYLIQEINNQIKALRLASILEMMNQTGMVPALSIRQRDYKLHMEYAQSQNNSSIYVEVIKLLNSLKREAYNVTGVFLPWNQVMLLNKKYNAIMNYFYFYGETNTKDSKQRENIDVLTLELKTSIQEGKYKHE